MVNIVYTLAAILLGLMLLDYIVDKITKVVLTIKLKKSLNKLSITINEMLEDAELEKEEEENEE